MVLYGVGVAVHIAQYKVPVMGVAPGHGEPYRPLGYWTPWGAYALAVAVGLLGLALAVWIYPGGQARRSRQSLAGPTS